jgi:hypothetical protein
MQANAAPSGSAIRKPCLRPGFEIRTSALQALLPDQNW